MGHFALRPAVVMYFAMHSLSGDGLKKDKIR